MSEKKQQIKNVPELRFPEFSGEWEEKKLGEISDEKIGGGTPKTKVKEFWTGNIPWIQSSDLKIDNIKKVEFEKFINEKALKASAAKLIPKSSIAIVTRVGVGKLALIEKTFATSQDFLSLSKLHTDKYFAVYSIYKLLKKESNNLQGTSIKGITKKDLLNKCINIPKEINEQKKIGAFFSKLDRQIELEEKRLALLEEQKKGYMQKIFSQELRFKDENGDDYPKWEVTTLGQLSNITTGSLDANAMVPNGKYMFFTCARETFRIDEYAFDTEALLISGNGANVGYIHHYKGKFNAYQRTYVLDNLTHNINFIKYYLQRHLIKRIYSEKRDGNTPYITRSTLYEMSIITPFDESEQEKIGEFFKQIDNVIGKQSNKVQLLKERKQGFLQKMFI